MTTKFRANIDFKEILKLLSKHIYDTPDAFIRENVQNSVDAILIQALHENTTPDDERYKINVDMKGNRIVIHDNGIGMSGDDLKNFFWTMGSSGKRTDEARQAGCIGMFGIGGFANFGVCDILEVISQKQGEQGTHTQLSREEMPDVTSKPSDENGGRGTTIIGHLNQPGDANQLCNYLQDFVCFVPVAIFFNGNKISQKSILNIEDRANLTLIPPGETQWTDGNLTIKGRLFENGRHAIMASINGLVRNGQNINLTGQLKFEGTSNINLFKNGFKLCVARASSIIGMSGHLNCDSFTPTAGRNAPSNETTNLLNNIAAVMERAAVDVVLASSDRIAQHTRIFSYVNNHNLIDKLDHVPVRLANGSDDTLGGVRSKKSQQADMQVFIGATTNPEINKVQEASGNIVILPHSDTHRRTAEKAYLEKHCAVVSLEGRIEQIEIYGSLSEFEEFFLREISYRLWHAYKINNFRFVPCKITADALTYIPVSPREDTFDIWIDVRHKEITEKNLDDPRYNQIRYKAVASFFEEYLAPIFKGLEQQQRLFGAGACDIDEFLAAYQAERWDLTATDILSLRTGGGKGGQHDTVTIGDVHQIDVQNPTTPQHIPGSGSETKQLRPRLLHYIEPSPAPDRYYIRLLDSAFEVYGSQLPGYGHNRLIWAGNRVIYVVSDAVSTVFFYDIHLEQLLSIEDGDGKQTEGAIRIEDLQPEYEGLYFPIPAPLEPFLVPTDGKEIHLDLHYDLIDARDSK